MDLSVSNKQYLKFIHDIFDISNELGIKTFVWGGLTTDIFEGEFLREHSDLDGFIENMASVLELLIEKYQSRGYLVKYLEEFSMLEVAIDENQYASFNPVVIEGGLAMWRHIGDRGTVYFPESWLDNQPRDFYDAKVYTSGLKFEYAFRQISALVNPDWVEREKDKVAKSYLEKKMNELNINPDEIMRNIWSYNPYWIGKGYDPFDKPTLVTPKY